MKSLELYSVIMAGGAGSRLWPLSTAEKPKPLLEVSPGKTLLTLTLERISRLSPVDKILLVVTEEMKDPLLQALPANFPKENILIEPVGKNTAPCAALAAHTIHQRDPDAIMGLFPADHYIQNTDHLADCLITATQLARETGEFILLGLKPQKPSSEYGYILLKERIRESSNGIPVYLSHGFLEKPDKQRAETLISEDKALWNSGIYVTSVRRLLQEVKNHLPQVYQGITKQSGDALGQAYANFPSISIDYALTERLASFLTLYTSLERFDIGHFNTLHELWDKDDQANAVNGYLIQIDSSGNIIHSIQKPVVLANMHDTAIIDTPEVILVCPRDKLDQIKALREAWIENQKK